MKEEERRGGTAPLGEQLWRARTFGSRGNSPANARAGGRDRCLGRRALSVTYLHMLLGSALSTTHSAAYVWWRSVVWKQGAPLRFSLSWQNTANDQQMDVTEWGWCTERIKGNTFSNQPDVETATVTQGAFAFYRLVYDLTKRTGGEVASGRLTPSIWALTPISWLVWNSLPALTSSLSSIIIIIISHSSHTFWWWTRKHSARGKLQPGRDLDHKWDKLSSGRDRNCESRRSKCHSVCYRGGKVLFIFTNYHIYCTDVEVFFWCATLLHFQMEILYFSLPYIYLIAIVIWHFKTSNSTLINS